MNDLDIIAKSTMAAKYLMRRIIEPVIEPTTPEQDQPVRSAVRAFCPACGDQVELVSFSGAAALFKRNTATINRFSDLGCVHRVNNRFGEVMVCRKSLVKCFSDSFEKTLTSQAD